MALTYLALRERVLHRLRQQEQADGVAYILARLPHLFCHLHVLKAELPHQLVKRFGAINRVESEKNSALANQNLPGSRVGMTS